MDQKVQKKKGIRDLSDALKKIRQKPSSTERVKKFNALQVEEETEHKESSERQRKKIAS